MNNKVDTTNMKLGKKHQIKPKLRFPVFREEGGWEIYFGDEIFDQKNNKNHESSLPILAITQEHGAIPRDKIDYQVSVTPQSIEGYKVVDIGDFIISLRSFQGGIEYSRYNGICSPAYIILRKKTGDSEAYFKQFFKTERFIQQLKKNIEGLRDGKMVSYKQFSELMLPIPSIDEQQKIADCLSSIDDLITAQSQKLDALKAHKKGLLQQLFPAEGKILPQLRFPEFWKAPEWEEKKLDDIANLINDRAGENKHTLMSVTAGVGLVSQVKKFGKEIAGNSYKNYFVIKEGDFTYNKSATKQYPEGFISMLEGRSSAAVPNRALC